MANVNHVLIFTFTGEVFRQTVWNIFDIFFVIGVGILLEGFVSLQSTLSGGTNVGTRRSNSNCTSTSACGSRDIEISNTGTLCSQNFIRIIGAQITRNRSSTDISILNRQCCDAGCKQWLDGGRSARCVACKFKRIRATATTVRSHDSGRVTSCSCS